MIQGSAEVRTNYVDFNFGVTSTGTQSMPIVAFSIRVVVEI